VCSTWSASAHMHAQAHRDFSCLATSVFWGACVQDKLKESGVVDKLAPVTSAATETKVSSPCGSMLVVASYSQRRKTIAHAHASRIADLLGCERQSLLTQFGSKIETTFNSQVLMCENTYTSTHIHTCHSMYMPKRVCVLIPSSTTCSSHLSSSPSC